MNYLEDINYMEACVKEPKKALQFLSRYLYFFDQRSLNGDAIVPNERGILIGNKLGNNYMLLSRNDAGNNNRNTNTAITIYTDDCLKDYHQLLTSAVKIEQSPRYTCRGLEVIIADNCGNKYKLLEQRDYSDM